ncbi:hypothetical protein NQ318_006377 [Aromia moschata]|uniref:Uncharacterized protein n=1 Tax=Aromia moschata TaxID=1265417 RepID=A0AAV8YI71_9CUCU|nr:hypothetical protein NQ318_006377 [Aromia moschata]
MKICRVIELYCKHIKVFLPYIHTVKFRFLYISHLKYIENLRFFFSMSYNLVVFNATAMNLRVLSHICTGKSYFSHFSAKPSKLQKNCKGVFYKKRSYAL